MWVNVTLYARVWIETSSMWANAICALVTLYARVWIETKRRDFATYFQRGHPLREGVD